MFLFALVWILFEFLLIAIYENAFFFYRAYWEISKGNQELWNEVLVVRRHIYFGTIIEEITFRMPLIYFTGKFSYYLSLIVFTIQHFDLKLTKRQNVRWMIFAGIGGYLFTECFLQHGILASILLHLWSNFLSELVRFPDTFRRKHLRKFIEYLDNKVKLEELKSI